MMKWKIVADSSCDLTESSYRNDNFSFATVPLKILFGQDDFIDNEDLDLAALHTAMRENKGPSSTTCPSPDEWYNAFIGEENVLAVTISSRLSGSYNSAMVARDLVLQEYPDKKIYVVDSRATAGAMMLIIEKAGELIAAAPSFDWVVEKISEFQTKVTTLCTLSSYENLVKNGRMSRFTGMVATSLGLRAVARATPEGVIEVMHKSRGDNNAIKYMVNFMSTLKDTPGARVIISHCNNLSLAQALQKALEAAYNRVVVSIEETRGLTSYYSDHLGIIVCYV